MEAPTSTLRCTTECIYNGISKQSSSVFDLGLIVDPFGDNVPPNDDRGPIMCICCAAYLSSYSQLDNRSRSWVCALCNSINPAFDINPYTGVSTSVGGKTPQLHELYRELAGANYTFTEDVSVQSVFGDYSGFGHGNTITRAVEKHVFAIERSLCRDHDAISMLCQGLSVLPDTCEVMVLVYDQHLRLLRLGGGSLSHSDPLSIDLLPGGADHSSLLAHQMRRNQYFVQAKTLNAHMDVLASGLASIQSDEAFADRSTLVNQVDCALDALVGAALTAIDPPLYAGGSTCGHQPRHQARLVLLTSKSVHCSGGRLRRSTSAGNSSSKSAETAGSSSTRLALYSSLGRSALLRGCTIDVFHASMRAANLDCLDAAASASGGCVVSASSFADAHLCASFMRFFARNAESTVSETIYGAIMPTLEVRTCGKIVVDRIVGPVASAEDAVRHNLRNAADNSKDAMLETGKLALDDAHLSQSLYYLRDYANPSTKLEDFQAQLRQRNQEQAVVSGITMRHRAGARSEMAQDAITIQLKLEVNYGGGSARGATSLLFARKSLAIGNSEAKESDNGSSDRSTTAYVQLVVRYFLRSAGKWYIFHLLLYLVSCIIPLFDLYVQATRRCCARSRVCGRRRCASRAARRRRCGAWTPRCGRTWRRAGWWRTTTRSAWRPSEVRRATAWTKKV